MVIPIPDYLISEIPCAGAGIIGLAVCPGKPQAVAGGYVRRDLKADIEAIKAWGAMLVVTLILYDELSELGVEGLSDEVGRAGMAWLHLPIAKESAPSAEWNQSWSAAWALIKETIDVGGRLLIHCEAGLGRSGMVAARILMDRGVSVDLAISTVRVRRPGALDEPIQVQYLLASKGLSQVTP
jgi:protein-tyrosine phosphatase